MSDADAEPCDWCGDAVANPLSRTVRVSVDRSQIDSQRLCPECFAEWVDRYETEMRADTGHDDAAAAADGEDGGTDIIVD
ncbi:MULTISPECIES: hypothetical protein [Halobacterium]|uniref:Small CPxCG-related zinc finger protein n=3 Tax=Halobacterium salinarum TaxID=2242 RepID=Q9HN06_HALSA|nr:MULTISPECIES: hypothetical protein [Halobacterium]AAG20415.1 hypothetical protein VNG_2304H [Halobacterium salinarum NRC-1]MBB6089658.1 hypothetical protein [Halobacterium salinarum]MCF2164408.1 hypothetical protein [Halobacterium salinarum]MCF2167195.1 hypothetical protein [Halobacterium salinarum]MCF2238459.1 hypothetical protein [Halobacterium salinarum]